MGHTPHINIQDKLSEMCRKCPALDLDVSVLHSNDEVFAATVYCRNEDLCTSMCAYLTHAKEVTNK